MHLYHRIDISILFFRMPNIFAIYSILTTFCLLQLKVEGSNQGIALVKGHDLEVCHLLDLARTRKLKLDC